MFSEVTKDGKRIAGSVAPANSVTSLSTNAVLSTVGASGEGAVNAIVEYEIPPWAGRPPSGCHLDVVKGDQLIQVCSFTYLSYRPSYHHAKSDTSDKFRRYCITC